MSKAEEKEILSQFNKIVEEISIEEAINPTLFFSKKSQKDFLRLVFIRGLDSACEEITLWRSQLIKEKLQSILK